MFELLSNLIVYGSLGGAVVVTVIAAISAVIKVAAEASVRNVTFPVPAAATPTDVCRYCSFKIAASTCDYCGGSNPQFVKVEA
jgi:hypothetical protein